MSRFTHLILVLDSSEVFGTTDTSLVRKAAADENLSVINLDHLSVHCGGKGEVIDEVPEVLAAAIRGEIE